MKNRAFTLIEILIIVVIMGIVAVVVIPQFTSKDEPAEVIEDPNTSLEAGTEALAESQKVSLKEKIYQVYANKSTLNDPDEYNIMLGDIGVKATFSDNIRGCGCFRRGGKRFEYSMGDMFVKVNKNKVEVFIAGERDEEPGLVREMTLLSENVLDTILQQQTERINPTHTEPVKDANEAQPPPQPAASARKN